MTRTLRVRIGTSPDGEDLKETLKALDHGEDVDTKPATLHIESLETFGRIFRATNLELLQAIADHDPESIRDLARIVDRNPPEVLENVHELERYGLLELEEEGQAKRPVIWYDEIDAALPIAATSANATAS